ncbi:RNA polymerase sigma factor [Mucilaginibacter dorajii]|uniref:RNA polymerase sigma-70 factor n=1 Tax=Mucilaginibacter dorajii TaxID=692994 RepID=A0ABP7QIH2_9SPHI|nr:sigma-70 family RNA polymerase sigma factor [Mucilaginibacter dorajii]
MRSSCTNKSDFELTNLLKQGNVLAFTELYKKYSGKMYINMYKMVKDETVVEEMIQILFSRIWQQREVIRYESDFAAYLYRAGSNLVCDFYRKLESDRKMTAHFKSNIIEHYSHIEEKIFFKESENLLNQALAELSPQQRQVYQLIKIDGFSYKETATKLDISPYTVKEYLSKAKNLVKSYMTKNMEIVTFLMLCFYIVLHC